jgi:hypothetical protein
MMCSKGANNGRLADDTSMGAGQADMSRGGRPISSSWMVTFIGFGSLLTMTWIIHHL